MSVQTCTRTLTWSTARQVARSPIVSDQRAMVNDERPRACLTCKRRKIKCDQVKPSCGRCVLAKEFCKWIKPVDKLVIRFVDINQVVATRRDSAQDKPKARPVNTNRAIAPRRDSSQDETSTQFVDKDQAVAVRHRTSQEKPETQSVDTPQTVTACYHKRIRPKASTKLEKALHDDIETQALAFFVRYYTLDSAPNGGPNPGLFGHVMPAVSSSRNSAAAMSVSAVALTVFSRWRMDRSLTKSVPKVLGQTIKSLSGDLQKQDSRRTDLTLLTTLLLQYHSAFESLLFSKKSTIVHHLGALALVKEFGHPSTWSAIASEFVGVIIHLDVTTAIREKRQVHPEVRYWRSVIEATSVDPSRYLDTLGIQVADMQFRASALQDDIGLRSSLEIYTLLDEIQRLDECLVLWQGNVSRFWGPFSWTPPGMIFPPIQAFQGSCHVYTSITAARRLNDSRSYRLTLALMSLKLIREQEKSNSEFCESPPAQRSVHAIVSRIQWLVDGICASVPFCLGNRSKIGTVTDFGDQIWTFPTCHDMSEMYGLYGRLAEPMGLVSRSDHYNHAIIQGSWLMLSNLALMVALFLSNKTLTPSFPLKEGQLAWICQQYLRNLSLNSIKWTHDSSLMEQVITRVNLPPAEFLISEASRCVRRVSRGLQLRDEP
jgi:hypothetical protein